jgi:hypothetical protein
MATLEVDLGNLTAGNNFGASSKLKFITSVGEKDLLSMTQDPD